MNFVTMAATLLVVASPARPDLKGTVTSENGTPVAGAEVFVAAAGPRTGSSSLCPSCYADCAKHTTTDAQGRFVIPSLDPTLLFRILGVRKGFKGKYASKVDPALGELTLVLPSFDPDSLPADRLVRGRILNPEGGPVIGAIVEPYMFDTVAFSGFSPDIFDPVAVSDASGEFSLTSTSPVRKLDVKVEGRGLASRVFRDLRPGNVPELQLVRGVEVSGRLVQKGKPVEGAVIGIVQVRRDLANSGFLGSRETATDREGRFVLSNIAPEDDYYIYGTMASLSEHGALASKEMRVGRDGSRLELGDLNVQAGHRLSGKVVLSDGKRIPAGTELRISRREAWDSRSTTLDSEGRFSMPGIPAEEISVSVALRNYGLSPKNKTRDADNPRVLCGYVEQDIDGLTILLEPQVE